MDEKGWQGRGEGMLGWRGKDCRVDEKGWQGEGEDMAWWRGRDCRVEGKGWQGGMAGWREVER